MRDDQIDLCGRVDFLRDEGMPLLDRKARFSFACAGCGDCCRGREDIVLSGYDLWRIAQRLDLPPKIVARGYCRSSIGQRAAGAAAGTSEGAAQQLPFSGWRPLCDP